MIKNLSLILGSIFLFLFLFVYIFFTTYISPGYVGVCINVLAKNDVQDSTLSTGIHLLAPWHRVWKFPVFEQNVSWENIDSFRFQTCEGLASNADIGITFCIDPEAAPSLFKRYRSGINEIAQKFIRNYLRDTITVTASSRTIEDLYGRGKEKFLRDVEQNIIEKLKPLGILVSRVYLVDAFEFPESVVRALNLKIEAAQRAEQRENELREAEAQAQKDIAQSKGLAQSRLTIAQAEATANELLTKSLTAEFIQYEAIKRWDGKLPETLAADVGLFLKGK